MVRHVFFGAVLVCCPLSAMAASQPFHWYGDVSGTWNSSNNGNTNWSLRPDANQNTSNLPDDDDLVTFSTVGATHPTVTISSSTTIDSLAFNGNAANSYTIKGSTSARTITLNAAGGTGLTVESASGQHTISVNLTLAADQVFEIQTPGTPESNTLLISGKISGSGRKLTKTGGGTLELTGGLNDYSGGTTLSAGVLRINNPVNTSATGSGAVLVDPLGTLGGNGHLTGAIDLHGTLAPGSSIGTLHTGDQNWFAGGNYQFEINAPAGTPGTNWDLLAINGTLNLASAAGFSVDLLSIDGSNQPAALVGFDNTISQSWVIAQTQGITNYTPGALSVDASGFANDLDGGTFDIGVDGNDLLLQFTPYTSIPEPAGLLLIAGVFIVLRRRRCHGTGL
ncbi:MAG: autotransporter-associated beta strand repeat-containing protein [Phycisphaerales bacterium]|nr:autotransporter-associated beta strand repeat-containing protein [Phycisphaerales bacterium]